MNLDNLSVAEKQQLLTLLGQRDEYYKYNKIATMFSTQESRSLDYPTHIAFMCDKSFSRMFCAANRIGKTEAASTEVVYHLTGEYPFWWYGHRFDEPVVCCIAGESSVSTRDILQLKLMGDPSEYGTGLIPLDKIEFKTLRTKSGVSNAIDTVCIKHKSGKLSTMYFKSFEQGRSKFQGTSYHVVLLDEETPPDIYEECCYRTTTVNGIILLTYTPFSGLTDLIKMHQDPANASTAFYNAGWDNGGRMPHLTQAMKDKLIAITPPNMMDVRTKGIPSIGAGAVYNIAISDILVDDFPLPESYKKAYSMDVGWNKTANLWGAWNDDGVCYIYSEHYVGKQEPPSHAQAIKARGEWIHGVIDSASHGASQADGLNLFDIYSSLGLVLSNANKNREIGHLKVFQMMVEGRLKIFKSCVNTINELRSYQYNNDGKIKEQNKFHAMDCLRYLCMSGYSVAKTNTQTPRYIPQPQATRGFI